MTHVLARVGAGSLVALLLATALGRGVAAQSAVPTPGQNAVDRPGA